MVLLLTPAGSGGATYHFVGANFPILSERGPDGSLGGIGVEIVRIICKQLGHTPVIELYPWARAQALVKSGQADVLIAPYKTPEREKWMDFSAFPFFEDRSFFFVRRDSTIGWNGNLQSVRDKRIGMVSGWSVGATFEQAKPQLTIDYAPNLELCFSKLLAGRIDMVPTQIREATVAFRSLGLSESEKPVTIAPILATHFNYFGFSKTNSLQLKNFKTAFEGELGKMLEDGELARIITDNDSTAPGNNSRK